MRWPSEDITKRVQSIWTHQRSSIFIFMFFSILTLGLQTWNLQSPLLGSHAWRQADTLFTGYFFCHEDRNILKPRIAQRENTDGIAIGEFPLYSWLASVPCQITGQWTESFPKVLSWFLHWLGSLLFALALVRKWGRKESFFEFATLLLCAEVTLTFFTRPLPDVLSFFLISCAGAIWTAERYPKVFSARYGIGLLLATLGFLVRPYLVILIFFVLPFGLFRWAICGLVIKFAYNWWFIEHTGTSSLKYYLMTPKTFMEAWVEFPGAILPFIRQTFKDHLNYILVPFFFFGFFRRFLTAGFWWLATLLVLFVSGQHFLTHPYYMLAPATLALAMAWSTIPTSKSLRTFILITFATIGVANTQHHFHDHDSETWKKVEALAAEKTGPEDRVVTLNSIGNQVPIYLYYAKRKGWSLFDTPENRQLACTLDAKLKLIVSEQNLEELSCSSTQE